MLIVQGRGKRRITIELPCGELMREHAKSDPISYKVALKTLCNAIGIA